MFQIVPNSVVLNYVILITIQLKWAWDYLLFQSFFHHQQGVRVPHYINDLTLTQYHTDHFGDQTAAECAVCLCTIDEGEEVRELRCHHLFHKACLDRWLGYGQVTCPSCRNIVKPPLFAAELNQQEVILINFCAARSSDDRCTWWLR